MSEQKTKEYVMLVALTVAFTALALLPIGALAFLSAGIVSALIGYCVTKQHYLRVTLQCLFVFIVYAAFSGSPLQAFLSGLSPVLCGLALGVCYNVGFSGFKTICTFTVTYMFGFFVNIKVLELTTGTNIFQEAVAASGQVYHELFTTAYASQLPSEEIAKLVSELTSMLLKLMPSLLMIVCICFALVYFYIFKGVLKLLKQPMEGHFESFSLWRAEKKIVIPFLILLVLNFIMPPNSLFSDALTNLIFVTSFLFFLFGLSYIYHLLKTNVKNKLLQYVILIVVFIASFTLSGIPFLALCVFGAADGFIDFRSKTAQKK